MSNIAFDGRSHVKRGSGSGAAASKLRLWMAWLAFICALVGGVTLTLWAVGKLVAWLVGMFFEPYLAWGLIALIGAAIAFDLGRDRIPNRFAIYGIMIWPSLWLSAKGGIGDVAREGITETNVALRAAVGPWVSGGSIAISFIVIPIAVVFAEKHARANVK